MTLVETVRGNALKATLKMPQKADFHPATGPASTGPASTRFLLSHNRSLSAPIIHPSLQGHVLLKFTKSFGTTHHIFLPLVRILCFPLDEDKGKAKILRGEKKKKAKPPRLPLKRENIIYQLQRQIYK